MTNSYHAPVTSVSSVVVATPVADVRASKLAGMVQASQEAAKVAKVEAVDAPAVAPKKKRVSKYLETRDTAKRDVVVIKSDTTKLAYIATNVQYTALKEEQLLPMLKVAVEARAKFAGLAGAKDQVAYVGITAPHSLEQDAKAKMHDALVDEGYTVLSTRGKGVPARVVEVQEVQEDAVETDV